jgi:hypothetical protein
MSFYNYNKDQKLNLEETLNNLINTSNYKFIYISIGSKYNSDSLISNNGCIYSNAYMQMIPMFLYNTNTGDKVLTIIIDHFESEQIFKTNKYILKQRGNNNIDTIIIKRLCTSDFLEEFLQFIINLLEKNKMNPNQFMICNFVNFINIPNDIEAIYQQVIPDTITKKLNTNSTYKNCFYQWFGYEYPTLYNMIYNVSYFNTFNKAYVLTQMSQFLNDPYSTESKFTRIHNHKKILSYIIDLSCPVFSEDDMYITLNDQLLY